MAKQESPKILVVDDEPGICMVVSEFLKTKADYTILTASDGEQGLACAREEHPQVIISDVMMPKLNGYEFFDACQTEGIEAPFIFYTGHGDYDEAEKVLKRGSFDYLEKPFEMEKLAAIVARAVDYAQRKADLSHREVKGIQRAVRLSSVALEVAADQATQLEQSEGAGDPDLSAEIVTQLKASEQALVSVLNSEEKSWELGFLYRFSLLLRESVGYLNSSEVTRLVDALHDNYMRMRIRPRLVNEENISKLLKAHKLLRDIVENTDSRKPPTAIESDHAKACSVVQKLVDEIKFAA